MFQSFFNGLSGMFSFSKSLDNVSNNIANMNTPGFRGKDSFYQNLSGGEGNTGLGTQLSGLGYRFGAGEVRQTGNATDVALTGDGFFTLVKDGQTLFSRAGRFSFDEDGNLVDKASEARVQAIHQDGRVGDFNIDNLRSIAPVATTKVNLQGNLSNGGTTHTIDNVTVFNKLGEEVELSLKFDKHDTNPGEWTVTVTDSEGASLGTATVEFAEDGSPKAGANSFSISLEDSRGQSSSVEFALGDEGSFQQATSVDGGSTSTLRAEVTDGSTISQLQSVVFGETGQLKLTYANGEERDGPSLAISGFKDMSVLEETDGSFFKATSFDGRIVTTAGSNGVGNVAASSLEMSNVDLSREFADMIVIQRGYQASSRVMNVSNQLLDQLFENTRGR